MSRYRTGPSGPSIVGSGTSSARKPWNTSPRRPSRVPAVSSVPRATLSRSRNTPSTSASRLKPTARSSAVAGNFFFLSMCTATTS